jgi:hypothetical protein
VSDQPPSEPWQQQGQQYPPQQPYGQQPYPPGQPPYGQQQPPGPYAGQPPYQGQPYGVPGQPPYPGPGYGYGPQPQPRRRKGHVVRNILAGIGAVVVAVIVIGTLSSHGSGVSTTPSGTSAAGSTTSPAAAGKPAVARIGSYFDVGDGSGDTYRVTLVKIIDPARGASEFDTPDNGQRFVAAVFKITALSGSPQDEDANNDAGVIGSNGQTYTADFADIVGYTNFSDGTIHVAQGGTVVGAVTFQVPDHVKVTQVQWSAASGFGSTVQWASG